MPVLGAASDTRGWVKPPPGRLYRIPATRQLLEPDGREVNLLDLDWVRALRDGDVVRCDPPAPPPAAASAKAAPAKASQPATEGEG